MLLSKRYIIFITILLLACKKQEEPLVVSFTLLEQIDLPIEINECSGICMDQGNLYLINDGGNGPTVFEIDTNTYELSRTLGLPELTNKDWEAIQSTEDYFVIGDIGNNFGNRLDQMVYYVDKEDLTVKHSLNIRFPDQTTFNSSQKHNFDCEAMIVFEDELLLFSKNRSDQNTKLYSSIDRQDLILQDSISVPGFVTDACYWPEKDLYLLIGGSIANNTFDNYLYALSISESYQLDSVALIDLPYPTQIEGITQADENRFYLGSEANQIQQGQLYHIELLGL